MPGLQPILRLLDESIRAAVPGVHYAVKWKCAYYGLADRYVKVTSLQDAQRPELTGWIQQASRAPGWS